MRSRVIFGRLWLRENSPASVQTPAPSCVPAARLRPKYMGSGSGCDTWNNQSKVVNQLVNQTFEHTVIYTFRSPSHPVFDGSDSGSEKNVPSAPAPAAGKMCRLRLRIPFNPSRYTGTQSRRRCIWHFAQSGSRSRRDHLIRSRRVG